MLNLVQLEFPILGTDFINITSMSNSILSKHMLSCHTCHHLALGQFCPVCSGSCTRYCPHRAKQENLCLKYSDQKALTQQISGK